MWKKDDDINLKIEKDFNKALLDSSREDVKKLQIENEEIRNKYEELLSEREEIKKNMISRLWVKTKIKQLENDKSILNEIDNNVLYKSYNVIDIKNAEINILKALLEEE